MFEGKTLLITGGTGSFGNAVIKRFIKSDIGEIRVFSRDEKKQDDMRKLYANDKLSFHLGDVREYNSILNVMRGVDFVFHAAALKQVPSCEFHPMEALKTNAYGTSNVLEAAIACAVKHVICLSTDKAVYPINAMGMSKALMEKVALAKAPNATQTIVSCTRYGNVMASRGSVIPLFFEQIKKGEKITLTNPEMTRFMMLLDQAVDLVIYAFENASPGDIFVPKAPSVTIETLANAIKTFLSCDNHDIEIIGTRHGEKLFESLISREEMLTCEDLGQYFRIAPDARNLNYEKYSEFGDKNVLAVQDYNSHNAQRLDELGMLELLKKLDPNR